MKVKELKSMTTGQKLAKLRREHGFTQEELAEKLGVTRQAVGRWETDASYPEVNNLVLLGKLYDCSMDYLLKDEADEREEKPVESPEKPQAPAFSGLSFLRFLQSFYFERKSKRTVGKLPLWHINIGFGRVATGVFAIGFVSRGIVTVGLVSIGLISLGLLSVGLICLGTIAAGIVAFGAIALGLVAFGAIAVGLLSVGAIAVGQYAVGALAGGGIFALGDHAYAPIAVGKTVAEGSIFSASAITAVNRSEILSLLWDNTPPVFRWLTWLITPFL